jgi:predicted nuclease of predicted toxin-antitoxin system
VAFGATRAYLDENLDPSGPVAAFLRRCEIDVLAVSARSELARRRDEFHYMSARAMQRLLVTRDRDFLATRFPLAASPGVLVLHAPTEEQAAHQLALFWTAWPPGDGLGGHTGTKVLVAAEGFSVEYLDAGARRVVAGCFLLVAARPSSPAA